jgi:hypothetical protein
MSEHKSLTPEEIRAIANSPVSYEQMRHAMAMARKIRVSSERITTLMDVLIENGENGQDYYPRNVQTLIDKFQHDSGYGLLDHVDAMLQVLTDMLGELPHQ